MAGFSIPLSGLAAASDSLDVIANNLANLNTDGYKDENVTFAGVFNQIQGTSGNGDPIQIGNGVQTEGTVSNFSDGNVNSTGIASNMALQGNGFFIVKGNNATEYTRDGDFTVNAQGQLTTQSGQLVEGFPAVNGVIQTSSVLAPITVNQASTFPAAATTNFQMNVNLDSTTAVGGTYSAPMTVYDSLGNAQDLTITFTNNGGNQWGYAVTIPSADVQGGVGTTTTLAAGNLTFNTAGQLTAPAAPIALAAFTPADGAGAMNLNWNVDGTGGAPLLTQEATASATTSPTQDGYGAGTLTGYSILPDGTVQGTFSNNQTLALGQVAIATFANDEGLTQVGNNNFQASFASGIANVGVAGVGGNGTITGGAVEASNVNLSTEFANMIVAQQGYEANAKVLTTLDQVSQATLQVIS